MNVLEALKQYDGYRLKVGCADGNSYWYVGTVAAIVRRHQRTRSRRITK